MKVAISASAERDLLEGFEFYERQQATLGGYFLDSLYADIDSLGLYAGVHPKPFGNLYRTTSRHARTFVQQPVAKMLSKT